MAVRSSKRALLLSGIFLALSTASTAAATGPARSAMLVTLSVRNAPIREVLQKIARAAHVDVTVLPGVSGYVTVTLQHANVADAFDAVTKPLGLHVRVHGSTYTIEPERQIAAPAGGVAPVVIPLTVITPAAALRTVRPLFPDVDVRADERSNALVALGSQNDLQALRTVIQGIDVRNPTLPTTEAVSLKTLLPQALVGQLGSAFPHARFAVAGPRQLLVTATAPDMTQIKSAILALEMPNATPPPLPSSTEAVSLSRREPRDVARAIASQMPNVRVAVSGNAVVLTGPPDQVQRAKTLAGQLDTPKFGDRITQVYKVRTLDAGSVADLLRRSFHDVEITVDPALNAFAAVATAAQQQRIADAMTQLDPAPGAVNTGGFGNAGGTATEVIALRSYVPGPTQGGGDAVAAITQALQIVAPDVRVAQLPIAGQIALIGPPASVRTAKDFVTKIDVTPALVVLDTEVLEVDESVAKNLGLQLGTALVSTTFTEATPPNNAAGTAPALDGIQALTRTPIQFTAELNLLVQNGKGRVLANPRITTLSGRTASIRAGDTISILTTTSGNAGTIATTQVQSFQTGVSLDITPSVTPDGEVMVNLHPVVNSLIGTNNGVPEISTRDTQTTVHLHNDETLVIGGLIQENETRTTTKLPFLGDLPLVGAAFRNDNIQNQRNELIIVVTPHIVQPGAHAALPGPLPHGIPTPQPLPTLPPNALLPPPSGQLPQFAASPSPAATNTPTAASPPTPRPMPSAALNSFVFGSAPISNIARATDPVQILYATISPTLVIPGTSVHAMVTTTTNATAVKLVVGSQSIGFGQTAPGMWQATFPFPPAGNGAAISSVPATLQAVRLDGTLVSIPVPFSVSGP